MTTLKTTYMGLELKNPLVVGASSLTADLDILKAIENAGAGAVVFKSLFEEQIQLEELEMQNELDEYTERHAEMTKLFPTLKHAGSKEHLLKLRKAKESLSIPVIASLNSMHPDTWLEYALEIEKTGVDGIELNFYTTPKDFEVEGKVIVQSQLDVLHSVRKALRIPVSVKLSPFYTNPLDVIKRMDAKEVQSFVIFNRMFQPDIDIEKEELIQSLYLSSSNDSRLTLQFTGLLYGNIAADICSCSGIMNGTDAIKILLAGATAFEVVSTLYQNGVGQIPIILKDIETWMNSKGYKSIEDFRGKLAKKNLKDPFAYRRAQYVEILMRTNDIMQKSKLV
ncbi:MAG: dihydroorotate dehydrogenase-like protein [Bacteroidales bacterium]|nr:MAG: dihydroorotate dehydrogenase-like protein [Bacteroidales bacterium]